MVARGTEGFSLLMYILAQTCAKHSTYLSGVSVVSTPETLCPDLKRREKSKEPEGHNKSYENSNNKFSHKIIIYIESGFEVGGEPSFRKVLLGRVGTTWQAARELQKEWLFMFKTRVDGTLLNLRNTAILFYLIIFFNTKEATVFLRCHRSRRAEAGG